MDSVLCSHCWYHSNAIILLWWQCTIVHNVLCFITTLSALLLCCVLLAAAAAGWWVSTVQDSWVHLKQSWQGTVWPFLFLRMQCAVTAVCTNFAFTAPVFMGLGWKWVTKALSGWWAAVASLIKSIKFKMSEVMSFVQNHKEEKNSVSKLSVGLEHWKCLLPGLCLFQYFWQCQELCGQSKAQRLYNCCNHWIHCPWVMPAQVGNSCPLPRLTGEIRCAC